MQEFFFQFRAYSTSSQLLQRGGATAAVLVVEEGEWHHAYIALALCSPRDQFDRKRGFAIASGRKSEPVNWRSFQKPISHEQAAILASQFAHRAWARICARHGYVYAGHLGFAPARASKQKADQI